MNTIACPHCGKPVEISSLLAGQIREKIESELSEKQQAEIEKVKQSTEKALKNRFEEEFSLKIKLAAENELAATERSKQLSEQLILLTKQMRDISAKNDQMRLEMEKKLFEEQDKIRKNAIDETMEKNKLNIKELEKTIDDLKKSLDDAQKKASHSSQQLQGEVQELDLEEALRREFPDDAIEPVGKGVNGADIRQIVKSSRGSLCGTILWESKRTKAWSEGWVSKLKDDMRADKASVGAILSEVLPDQIKTIGVRDGIWVAAVNLCIPLAALLRDGLIKEARQRYIHDQRSTKADELYSLVTSNEFTQYVESMLATYLEMKSSIDKERMALEKSWKMREQQLSKLMQGVSGMYGSIQGIAGSALPQISTLSLPE